MDDGRIGDEMTLEGIAKRLDDISARLGSVQSDTTSLKGQVGSLSGHVTSLDGQVTSMGQQVTSLGGQVASLDGQVKSLDGKLIALDHKMTIEFESTRGLVNLGFENVQMLREEVGRRFDDTDLAHADHKSLLEAALVRLRRDMTKPRSSGRGR